MGGLPKDPQKRNIDFSMSSNGLSLDLRVVFNVSFLPNLGQMRIFSKNRAPSVLCLYGSWTSCKKSEKSYEPILRNEHYERTDGRKDRDEFIGHLRLEPGDQ